MGTTGACFLLFGDVETSALSVIAGPDPALCSASALVKVACGLLVLVSSFVFLSFPFNDATIAATEPEDVLVNGLGGIGLVRVRVPAYTLAPAAPVKTFFAFTTSGVTGDINPLGGDPLMSNDLRGIGGASRRVGAFCSLSILILFLDGEILGATGIARGGKEGARRAPAETLMSEVEG